jgi:MarR family transcriptional repressor of emrRAB
MDSPIDLAKRIEDGIARVRALHPAVPTDVVRLVRLTDFVARTMLGRLEGFFARHGLTDTSWLFLMSLYTAPGAMRSPSEVSRVLAQSKPHMTRLSDGLLAKGLIRRAHSEDDRRRVLLALSPKGKALVERLMPQVWAQHQQLVGGLSSAEIARLSALLARWLTLLDGSSLLPQPPGKTQRMRREAAGAGRRATRT